CFMLSHEKCGARYALSVDSMVKRALFTSPVAAKSRSLGATFVVAKSRFSVAKNPTTTNKISSASSLSLKYGQSGPLRNYMKNKIATSRKWQKWFEYKPSFNWSPKSKTAQSTPSVSKSSTSVIHLILWIVDSGCSKHMTGNLQLLINFVEKFMGTVHFRNDHFATITGYGDYVQGNLMICHNLEGEDLLTGSCDFNLYTILIFELVASSPVCLMSKATSIKSWLWHQRLSHLNFGTINYLKKKDLVDGLLKFKYDKDHLCSACEQGKIKKASFPPKLVPSTESKLELLHMDLYGLMRVASINGKRYILVIVDDYSQYTWAQVLKVRSDNGTEFKNEKLRTFYAKLGITHNTSTV
ncbi:retrovirus-related pol polyprotein from transposon TNT 1-94, partial [Tanacetum coccineum]